MKNLAYFIDFDSFKRGLTIIAVIAADHLNETGDDKLD